MIRRQWEFINQVTARLSGPPASLTTDDCTSEILDVLKRYSPGERTRLDTKALRCTAFLYADMAQTGRNVITPIDIEDAIEFALQQPAGDQKVQLRDQIPNWFGIANLRTTPTDYCRTDYHRHDAVQVAPIIAPIESILGELDNPPCLSNKRIDRLLYHAFLPDDHPPKPGSQAPSYTIPRHEIDALSAWVKSALEADGWRLLGTTNPDAKAWVNPDHLATIIRQHGAELSERDIKQILTNTLLNSLQEVAPSTSFIVDGFYDLMKTRLKRAHDWRPLVTADETIWVNDLDAYRLSLCTHFDQHYETIQSMDEASTQELQRTAAFLEHNEEWIVKLIHVTRDDLHDLQSRLRAKADANNSWGRLSQATTKGEDDFQTGIESNGGPTTYDVVRRIEQQLAAARDEDETDPEDSGLGGLRF